ncbi:MAG: sugar isomerase domain-containing protein [Planctomycetaceae bacterium]
MGVLQDYLDKVSGILQAIAETEEGNINRAAELAAKMVEEDRLIHVFGTGGHSIMAAMEVFWRAGGLANINPLFPPGVSLIDSHPNVERTTGLARSVLKFYGVKQGDLLILVNVNGINALTIDSAIFGKELGATVVAITSPAFARSVPPNIPARHPNNKNLHDLADIVIDVHVPPGDAVLSIGGLPQKVGATSTFAVCYTVNSIIARTVEILAPKGLRPPVWTSANIKGGDEANREYVEKYLPRIHHLYPMF